VGIYIYISLVQRSPNEGGVSCVMKEPHRAGLGPLWPSKHEEKYTYMVYTSVNTS
jgi:hypothetical protein